MCISVEHQKNSGHKKIFSETSEEQTEALKHVFQWNIRQTEALKSEETCFQQQDFFNFHPKKRSFLLLLSTIRYFLDIFSHWIILMNVRTYG